MSHNVIACIERLEGQWRDDRDGRAQGRHAKASARLVTVAAGGTVRIWYA